MDRNKATPSSIPSLPVKVELTRRSFLASLLSAVFLSQNKINAKENSLKPVFLEELDYGNLQLADCLARKQFEETISTIMGLDENSMLRPLRMRCGVPAPGIDLGGWYDAWDGTDIFHDIDRGFAPAHCFGQWISALARAHAITGDTQMKAKAQRLIAEYARLPVEKFYDGLRYPGYTYDKMVCALLDARKWAAQNDAFEILNSTTDRVLPLLPEKALDHDELRKRPHIDESYCWDETYTMPENLFLAYQQGAGKRYKEIAERFLKDDTFFTPLSEGRNVLPGHHAYSYCNSLSSAMQAYMVTGSRKHFEAARNAFDMLQATQSFATGGWGPNESFVEPGKGELAKSLRDSHKSFETPCGAYAHFKLCRYLLRSTRDPKYGDSLEQVFYNTILGAKPLQADGRGFYYSDYNFSAQKYYRYAWHCCTGSITQLVCDYHICAYFQDSDGLYVNLYMPSTLKFSKNGSDFEINQSTDYPLDELIKFDFKSNKSARFKVRFRIPAWLNQESSIYLNGQPLKNKIRPDSFAEIDRLWQDGDCLELRLPLSLRLLPLAPESPELVALMHGPLALFGLTDKEVKASTKQLLGARRTAKDKWQVKTSAGDLTFVPFTSIDKETYSLYCRLSPHL